MVKIFKILSWVVFFSWGVCVCVCVVLGFEFRSLTPARQLLYYLSPGFSLCVDIFEMGSPKLFAQGWFQAMILLIFAS
jgi:hypothetical protein